MIDINTFLAHNQFLSGGLVLGAAGLVWQKAKSIPSMILTWVKNRYTMSCTIYETDDAYEWVRVWTLKNLKNRRHVSAISRFKDFSDSKGDIKGETVTYSSTTPIDDSPVVERSEGELTQKSYMLNKEVLLVPGTGEHFGWWDKRPIWITREDKSAGKEDVGSPDFWKKAMKPNAYVVRFFAKDPNVMKKFIQECQVIANPPKEFKVKIKVNGSYSWTTFDSITPRPFSSIVFNGSGHEELLDDIKQFLKSKHIYSSLGIPYHRGYMLSGPPGNGKSSLIKAVASELKKDIYLLNLSSVSSDSALTELLSNVDKYAILVLEDIDCAVQGRENNVKESKLTFSGLLNAIDGVCTKEGQILFMTSNHPEKLDPALIRPGRVDRVLEFTNASYTQKVEMAVRFGKTLEEAHDFAKSLPEGINMAHVQGNLLQSNCPVMMVNQ